MSARNQISETLHSRLDLIDRVPHLFKILRHPQMMRAGVSHSCPFGATSTKGYGSEP